MFSHLLQAIIAEYAAEVDSAFFCSVYPFLRSGNLFHVYGGVLAGEEEESILLEQLSGA